MVINEGESTAFQAWVNQKGMIDLGFVGARFTWNHGTNTTARHLARLDIAIGDDEWRRLFPMVMERHLSHCHSDHCPLLLELVEECSNQLGDRPFCFEAAWITNTGFVEVLKEWKNEMRLPSALKDFVVKLKAWNE